MTTWLSWRFTGIVLTFPENDGSALGAHDIPLVINVGADQQVPQSNTAQRFVNAVEKGPATTLRHLAFVSARLRELSPQVLPVEELVLRRECTASQRPVALRRPHARGEVA